MSGETGGGMSSKPFMVTSPMQWNRDNKVIDIESPARFRTIRDGLNAVFDCGFRGMQRCQWDILGLDGYGLLGWRAWFPKISTDGSSWDGTWLNTLDPVTHDLTERYLLDGKPTWDDPRETRPRVTFGRFHDEVGNRDALRFIGVYAGENHGRTSVYHRIATSFPVTQGHVYELSDLLSIDFVGATLDWPGGAGYEEGAPTPLRSARRGT